ncbi:MAG: Hpt domain-containing protein [bacterium]
MYLDREKIREELGIDEETYHELLGELIIQAKDFIEKLDEAIHADDFDQAARIAHALRGMVGNFRIEEIQNIARSIELGSKNDKDKKAVEADMARLKTSFHELEQFLS